MNFFCRAVAGGCIAIAAVTVCFGEELKVESNVFTFPSITAVRVKPVLPQECFFKTVGCRPLSRSLTFSWAFPGAAAEQSGKITIYSLLGRTVATLPVQKNTGSATWRFTPMLAKNGLFIARISYGNNVRNLKLMLWN